MLFVPRVFKDAQSILDGLRLAAARRGSNGDLNALNVRAMVGPWCKIFFTAHVLFVGAEIPPLSAGEIFRPLQGAGCIPMFPKIARDIPKNITDKFFLLP